MGIPGFFLAFGSLCVLQIQFLEASYRCGIRKHSLVSLVHQGWKVEQGQWPWHVAMFHKSANGSSDYACGGTLLDQKHVLTAAHCVMNHETNYPMKAKQIELHFGQYELSKREGHTQIRDVTKVHVHPEHSTHRNDVAVLVVRLPVEYTDFVIPICMDRKADRDLRNLEDQRGWITGWGTTQSGNISNVLWSASMPVVSYLQCIKNDIALFGNIVNEKVFCAGDRNGTSAGTGDSGGGMYFSEGDRWVLRGIVSFAKFNELQEQVDTSKYAVFVNVQHYLTWIREIMDQAKPKADKRPKRLTEMVCDYYENLASRNKTRLCDRQRYSHVVSIIDADGQHVCNGALISNRHVLTTCTCMERRLKKIRHEAYGVIDVQEKDCHPQYREERPGYDDLAIFTLESFIPLSSSMIPACVATNWTENLYDTLILTGFGESSLTGIKTFIESEDNTIINKTECERQFIPLGLKLQPGHLCTVNKDRAKSMTFCSGACPLQSINTRTCMVTIVGINSVEIQDDITQDVEVYEESNYVNKTAVNLYTRVSHYQDWLEEIIGDQLRAWMTTRATTSR